MKRIIFIFISCILFASEQCHHNESPTSAKELLQYQNECDLNSAKACHKLSLIYFRGINKNTKLAKQLAQKACELGSNEACHNLGNIYKYALVDTKLDYEKAIKFYKKSCEQNHAISCYELATLYQFYLGKNSVEYHKKACELDFAQSCYQLGFFNYFKKFNLSSIDLALQYFLKGCKLNNNLSCMMAANIYERQNNIKKAKEFFNKACLLKSFTSCDNLKRLEDK